MADINKLKNILENYETDPNFTLILLEDYLKEYPTDINAYYFYVSLLITIGRFDDANNCINNIEKDFTNFRQTSIYKKILFLKLRLLMYSQKYEEALDLMKRSQKDFIQFNPKIDYYKLYCEQKIYKNKKREMYSDYLLRQFVLYDKKDFLLYSNNFLDTSSKFKNVFNSSFDFKKVLFEVEAFIPNRDCFHKGLIEDDYYFKYDGCGKVNYEDVDYFKVIVIHDTCNILTIYPVDNASNLLYIDLNYLKKNKMEVGHVKKKS